jgi:cytochrome P450
VSIVVSSEARTPPTTPTNTTAHVGVMGNGLLAFRSIATVPRNEWDARRVRDAMNVVNEAMRLHPIIPEPGRQPAVDIVHRGVCIHQGTPLFLSAASANRDPTVFVDPDLFDPDRHNANKQLGFGAGPHYCLGANLARAEMAEALPILAGAMPNLRVIEFREVEGQNTIRRAESFRVAFDPPG